MAIFESILFDKKVGQCGVTGLFTECRQVTIINNLNILERVMGGVNIFTSAPVFAFLYKIILIHGITFFN